ncbi:MAG: adenosylhomocysteinase [Planctomycetota bacterium]|jgi:adenosylhomocysteinase
MDYDITDPSAAQDGVRQVEWADRAMPVLAEVRKRFQKERPLENVRISACLHITAETANLARTLKAGGADLVLCASNPLSTQDDVAAALVEQYEAPVFARRGEDGETYYKHIEAALAHEPNVTMDDGADLVTTILTQRTDLAPQILASMEETTTGVNRLRAMESDGVLQFPVFAINDAMTKHLFDNRYGTGQSTVDGILRATGVLLAGMRVVVAGYGMCGRGVALRMKGMGAHVVVTEVSPLRALEAAMDGFDVLSMEEAAPLGDLFITLTGNADVLRTEHFTRMKDGALLANSGHFNVEINIGDLSELAEDIVRGVRPNVDEFRLQDGRRIYLLGEGRLINLAAAEGHPACVMDMSFALQALTTEYAVRNHAELPPKVHRVPDKIDQWVAQLKLQTMGISIDSLTERQQRYMSGWQEGT